MIITEDHEKRFVVLVIEDSHVWQDFFAKALNRLRAVTLPALTHEEACEAIEIHEDRIDLVILDPCISSPFQYDADLVMPMLLPLARRKQAYLVGCSNDGSLRARLRAAGCTHTCPKDELTLPRALEELLGEILARDIGTRIIPDPIDH